MQAIRRREVDVLVVFRLSRLARSLRALVTLSAELEALGVDLVSLNESIDTTTLQGRLLFGIMASLAQFESDLIADNIARELGIAKGTVWNYCRSAIDG